MIIRTSQVIDGAVVTSACQVAGTIHACPGGLERASDEALGSQARAAQVATRQPKACNVELALSALRNRFKCGVKNVELRVPDWSTDRRCAFAVFLSAFPHRDVDGCFRGSIHVPQTYAGQTPECPGLQRSAQGLSARHKLENGITVAWVQFLKEQVKH